MSATTLGFVTRRFQFLGTFYCVIEEIRIGLLFL